MWLWLWLLLIFAGSMGIFAARYVNWQQRQRRDLGLALFSAEQRLGVQFSVGLLAGLALSLALWGLGVTLQPNLWGLFWVMSGVAWVLFSRPASPLLPVALWILVIWIWGLRPDWVPALMGEYRQPQMAHLLWIAGALVLMSGWLLAWRGKNHLFAFVHTDDRGRAVGGYAAEAWWPLPLLLWVPSGEAWPVWPLQWPWHYEGWLVPFPFYIGYSFGSTRRWVEEHLTRWGSQMGLVGAGVILSGLLSPWLGWSGSALLALLLLSGLLLWQLVAHWVAENRAGSPLLADSRGLRVLAVLPDSPAAEMNIRPGELIVRVNQQPVQDDSSLYEALQLNPAMCRLEVLDRQGEVRILQRALYEGEHHRIGIISVPQPKRRPEPETTSE